MKKCHTSTYPPSYLLRFDYLSNNVSFMISHWQSFEYSSLFLRSVHGQALKRNSVEFENVRLIKVSILKVGLLRVSSNALLSRVIQITRGQSNAASLASVPSPPSLQTRVRPTSPPFYGPLITFVPNETSVFPRLTVEAECTFHCRPIKVALSEEKEDESLTFIAYCAGNSGAEGARGYERRRGYAIWALHFKFRENFADDMEN